MKKKKINYTNKININDPLNWWNKFWLAFAIFIIIIEFVGLKLYPDVFKPFSILIISIGIPYFLIIFQYRQLRKKQVFRLWFILCLFLLGGFLFTEIPDSIPKEYLRSFQTLKTPIVFLISFYIFRKISKSIWKTELIIPQKGNRFDFDEGRNYNLMDYIAFFSYSPIFMLINW